MTLTLTYIVKVMILSDFDNKRF